MSPKSSISNKIGCKLPLVIIIVFTLIFLFATLLVFVLFRKPQTVILVRDFMIIILAIESIIIGMVIIIATIQTTKYIRLIRDDIKPILDQTSDTINTIQDTASMINSNLTTPITKISSTYKKFTKLLNIFWPTRNQ